MPGELVEVCWTPPYTQGHEGIIMKGLPDIVTGTFPGGENLKYLGFNGGMGVEEVGKGFLLVLFLHHYF